MAAPHQLYVKTGDESDTKSRGVTVAVLEYVRDNLKVLRQMGITLNVNRVRPQDVRNPSVVGAMRARGITRLPALVTPTKVYIGFDSIRGLYEQNIREFTRADKGAPDGASSDGDGDGDDLNRFYRGALAAGGVDEEEEPAGGMMEEFQKMKARREESQSARPSQRGAAAATGTAAAATAPVAGAAAAAAGAAAVAAPAAAPAAAARAEPRLRRADDQRDDNVDTDALIDRLAHDIDGDGDDGTIDPKDDLMMRAYWGNRVEI
jgi:hypothetical protein